MIFLLLLSAQRVPPFTEDFKKGSVILIGVTWMNQGSMTLAEDHESVHRSANVILFFGLPTETIRYFIQGNSSELHAWNRFPRQSMR